MFKPVPRKGTVKLLQLTRAAKEGNEDAVEELFQYIGRLEESEAALLRKIDEFHRNFNDDSFMVYGRRA